MSVFPLKWDDVRSACERTTARVTALIRSAPDPAARVPGLEWTVAELAAHLVSLTQRYDPFVRNEGRPAFDSMPELNAEELGPLARLDLQELADRLERGTTSLLSLCPSGDAPARFFDMESDCASAMALYFEELLLHGWDLARADGTSWPMTRDEALVALAGTLQVLPKFVDPQATRGFHSVYEIRFRGGPTVAVAVDDGTLTVTEGKPTHADCRMSADPVAFLLVGIGRESQWRAVLTGKIVVSGRKPWLGLRFNKLFRPA